MSMARCRVVSRLVMSELVLQQADVVVRVGQFGIRAGAQVFSRIAQRATERCSRPRLSWPYMR